MAYTQLFQKERGETYEQMETRVNEYLAGIDKAGHVVVSLSPILTADHIFTIVLLITGGKEKKQKRRRPRLGKL